MSFINVIGAKVIIIPSFRWDEVIIVLHWSVYKEKGIPCKPYLSGKSGNAEIAIEDFSTQKVKQ
jgi:hypothetical protein